MFVTDATRLPRIMACNGSRLMSPSFPKIDDPTARDEGTAAHYMAQTAYSGTVTMDELIDRKASNGFYMTMEMSQHVQSYIDMISQRYNYVTEMEVETSFGDGVNYQVNARADHIALDQGNHLYIDDFKYGWSPVNVENNWTLIAHAVGYCQRRQITPAMIHMTIHQPRPHHPDGKIRTWSITYPELTNYYATIGRTLSNLTDQLHTGSHCRKCHALATCPAARLAEYNAIDASDVAFDDEIDNELLTFELDTLRTAKATIEARLTALEDLTMHRLRTGQVIDMYGIERQFGNRRFKSGLEPVMIGALLGIDVAKPGTITPAEAERRLIAKGKDPAVLDMFVERPEGGTKLVRRSADAMARKLLKEGK